MFYDGMLSPRDVVALEVLKVELGKVSSVVEPLRKALIHRAFEFADEFLIQRHVVMPVEGEPLEVELYIRKPVEPVQMALPDPAMPVVVDHVLPVVDRGPVTARIPCAHPFKYHRWVKDACARCLLSKDEYSIKWREDR